MERAKKLRKIIILLIVLFLFGLVLLTMMIPTKSFTSWIIIGGQLIVILYFSAISFGLIKEAEERDRNEEEQKKQ